MIERSISIFNVLSTKNEKPKFSDKSLELAINDYYSLEFVEYREDQAAIVKFIADLMRKQITMNDLAMQGFIMRAIRKWQIDSGIKISALLVMTPKERIHHVGLMFENLRTELKSVLLNTRGAHVLDHSIDEAFQAYIDNFSQRKSKLY